MSCRGPLRVTGFTPILNELVTTERGMLGAALVDGDGEIVDFAVNDATKPDGSQESAESIAVTAAIGAILARAANRPNLGDWRRLAIVARDRALTLHRLDDGYALVTLADRWAQAFEGPDAALKCLTAIRIEAGWSEPARPQRDAS
jgi:hypothetical protein